MGTVDDDGSGVGGRDARSWDGTWMVRARTVLGKYDLDIHLAVMATGLREAKERSRTRLETSRRLSYEVNSYSCLFPLPPPSPLSRPLLSPSLPIITY